MRLNSQGRKQFASHIIITPAGAWEKNCSSEQFSVSRGERKQSAPRVLMEVKRGCIYDMIYTRSGTWVQKLLYGAVAEMIKTNADCYLPLFLCEQGTACACLSPARCKRDGPLSEMSLWSERTHWDVSHKLLKGSALETYFYDFWHRPISVDEKLVFLMAL